MELPKFLVADNTEYPENVYVVHTQTPRFILDIDSEDVEFLEDAKLDSDAMTDLVQQALDFYQTELDVYDEEDDDEEYGNYEK